MRRRVGSVTSVEDDIFSAVGGLELGHEGDTGALDSSGSLGASSSSGLLPDFAPAEQPARSLFVRNVAPDVTDEEIRQLFQAHGDIRTLYTACKHRGFVIISYYDLRSSVRACQLLQGAVLGGRPLEVAFSAPKDKSDAGVNQVGCHAACPQWLPVHSCVDGMSVL